MEYPLICMEVGVIIGSLDGSGTGRTDESIEVIASCIESVKKHDGIFTVLWHNSEFKTSWDREVYRSVFLTE